MKGISLFYAYAVRNMAHGETFLNTAVSSRNNDTLEVLDSFLAALDNLVAHFYGVAYVKYGKVGFHVFRVDRFDQIFHV